MQYCRTPWPAGYLSSKRQNSRQIRTKIYALLLSLVRVAASRRKKRPNLKKIRWATQLPARILLVILVMLYRGWVMRGTYLCGATKSSTQTTCRPVTSVIRNYRWWWTRRYSCLADTRPSARVLKCSWLSLIRLTTLSHIQARNQLGTPGGAEFCEKGTVFLNHVQYFKLRPTHFSRGGEKNFRGEVPLVTVLATSRPYGSGNLVVPHKIVGLRNNTLVR